MRAKLLLLILLTACASEHDLTDAAGGGAAGGRPEPSVSVDQFVAPSDVGVSTEALTQSFAFINNENGAQINRSNTSWDGLRCWVMRRCTTGCTNHDFTCTFNWPTPGNTKCAKTTGETYVTSCGPSACNIIQQGNGGVVIGAFTYGTDSTYVFKSGNAVGWPYMQCKLGFSGAILTASTNPL